MLHLFIAILHFFSHIRTIQTDGVHCEMGVTQQVGTVTYNVFAYVQLTEKLILVDVMLHDCTLTLFFGGEKRVACWSWDKAKWKGFAGNDPDGAQ